MYVCMLKKNMQQLRKCIEVDTKFSICVRSGVLENLSTPSDESESRTQQLWCKADCIIKLKNNITLLKELAYIQSLQQY